MTDFATLILGARTDGLKKGERDLNSLAKTGERTESRVEKSTGGMAASFKRTHVAIAAAATAAVALAASLGSTIRIIREFDSSMSQVAAITRATGGELQNMRDIAKELGRTTEFTAAQAADGLKFLGMAGFEASESMAAIPAVLDLATAAAMDLGSAADIVSNIMSGFGIAAEQASSVTDILAAASSRANTTVEQLGGAMSTVAPIAAALGIDLADTASAISSMSDAGIQGERAGTALRGVLASLAGPTKQASDALATYGLTAAQVDPQTHSLAEIFGTLRERGLSTADAMTIFGREAASGALVLVEASSRVGEFASELRDSEGAAAEMANTMRDNLGGDAAAAASAIQGLAIAIGEAGLTAIIRGALRVATAFARGLTSLTESVSNFFTAHDPVESAVRAAAEAMNQEAIQALQLSNRLLEMGEVSYDVLGAKIALVETTLRGIEATRQEAIATAKTSDAYQKAANTAEQAREVIKTYQDMMGAGMGMSDENLASYEEWIAKLKNAVAVQERIVAEAGEVGPKYEQAVAELDILKAYLADANGDTVKLGQNTESVVSAVEAAAAATARWESMMLGVKAQLSAIGSLISQLGGGAISAAAKQTEISALRAGASLKDAAIAASEYRENVELAAKKMELNAKFGSTIGGLMGKALDAQVGYNRELDRTLDAERAAAAEAEKLAAATGRGSKAAGGISKEMRDAAKSAKDLADEIERLEFDADPMKKYNKELDNLNKLLESGLSKGAYDKAVQKLNDGLADQLPMVNDLTNAWADFVSRGFRDFKGFVRNVWDSFKSLLSNMIATAARNKIVFAMTGAAGGGIAGTVANAAGGGGGILGGLFGGGGSGGGLLSGGIGGLFGTGGTFGTLGANIAGTIGNVIGGVGSPLAASMAGIGSVIGAAVPIIGGIAAAVSFFKTKTKELDSGLNITVTNMDTLVQSFKKVEKSKFWGLSKKTRETMTGVSAAVSDPIAQMVRDMGDSVLQMSSIWGIADDALNDFSASMKISLKGLSDEQAKAEIEKQMRNFSNLMIGEIFGGDLSAMQRAGEDATQTLTTLYAGYSSLYTETERTQMAIDALTKQFKDLGVGLPRTQQQMRGLIDATIAAGDRKLAADLMRLGPAFVDVAAKAGWSADRMSRVNAETWNQVPFGKALDDELKKVTDTIRSRFEGMVEAAMGGVDRLVGLADPLNKMSQKAAQDIVLAARATGNVAEDAFKKAVGVFADLDMSAFSSRLDYDRERLTRASLLAGAGGSIGAYGSYQQHRPTAQPVLPYQQRSDEQNTLMVALLKQISKNTGKTTNELLRLLEQNEASGVTP